MPFQKIFLFLADMVQAVGAVMDIRWIHRGEVVAGQFCTTQGFYPSLPAIPSQY
jgi:hypothetical protein